MEGREWKLLSRDEQQKLNLALLEASLAGNLHQVVCLLEKGAQATACDSDFKTPLHHAAMFDHQGIATLLLKHGADPDAKDRCNGTPRSAAWSTTMKKLIEEHKSHLCAVPPTGQILA